MKSRICIALLALGSLLPATMLADYTTDEDGNEQDVLIILTSEERETRGMAMVLASAMAEQGARLHVLLCDSAGELGLKDYRTEEALAPRGMRPEQLLQRLQEGGAQVEVCALFLPNRDLDASALRDGVGTAMPPEIAARMLDAHTRVFSF